jgi:hypothetical protein
MYIDSATRPGMSGSPVLLIEKRPACLFEGDINKPNKFSRNYTKFVGVYSGRFVDDELKAELGIVWKYTVIDEIISQK